MAIATQAYACSTGNAAFCAVGAAYVKLGSGGSIQDAAKAAAFAYVSAEVFSAIGKQLTRIIGNEHFLVQAVAKGVVHGTTGGGLRAAFGGSFQEGFISNAIGAAAGVVVMGSSLGGIKDETGIFIRTAIVGSVGGLSAQLTGGKFENGFASAAIAHAFNQELHRNVPKGTAISPYGERVVPLAQMPQGSQQILQYRIFVYDEETGEWKIGFHFPDEGLQVRPTRSPSGAVNGFVIAPEGSPPLPPPGSGKNPIAGLRYGYSNEVTGQPYFRAFNDSRQPISPVTGQVVHPKSNEAHYPWGTIGRN
ncbi:MAG: hypothetical protein GY791_06155 [Alphaproteobacteria bacterium]|nr:hypothetical protein [Alphaproteobacteria bacterium]